MAKEQLLLVYLRCLFCYLDFMGRIHEFLAKHSGSCAINYNEKGDEQCFFHRHRQHPPTATLYRLCFV